MNKRKFLSSFSIALLALAILAGTFSNPQEASAAGAPAIITYQGRLADQNGDLLGASSGTVYFFKFSLWTTLTVGTGSRVWPTLVPSVASSTVKQGLFTVNIGDTTNGYPDTLDYNFSNPNIYLQVEVSTNGSSFETLSPRQRMASAPFAQMASVAASVNGSGDSLLGNATTTNLFSTTASSTNLFAAVANLSSLIANNATSTNIFSTTASSTNLFAAVANLSSLASASVTSGSLTSGTLSATNATTTNIFSTTASSTNLFSTNASTTNFNVSGVFSGAGLTNCNSSSDKVIWANGRFGCGLDAGGLGGTGITALGISGSWQTGSTQTLATSSDTNITLSITSGSDTQTFIPGWVGQLAVGRGGTGLSAVSDGGLLIGAPGNTIAQVGTSTLSIGGNAGTVTNGVYTTTFNGLFDTRLNATTTLPNLAVLKGLTDIVVGRSTTTAATSTNLFATNAVITNLTATNPINGSITGSAGSVDAGALTGTTLASGVTASSLTSLGTVASLLALDATSTNLFVTNAISGSITGNASTVTDGVYTTTFGDLFDTRLNATTTLPNLTILLGLSDIIVSRSTTTAATSTNLFATNAVITNLTATNPITGSVTGSAGSVAASALTGNTLAVGVTNSSLTSLGTIASLLTNNATTTNIFSTTASSTNLFASASNLGSATSTNLFVTNTISGSINGNASTVTTNANLTGDVSSVGNSTTLATVNTDTGSFGSSTAIPNFTVNGKGLITAAGTSVVIAPAGTLTGNTLASGVTASSLTSLGTIASLLATNATTTNVFSTTASSTNLFASLSNLGNATSSNLFVTNAISGSITGSAGSVAASALTGTTLASNVTASSLTSLSTLNSLSVSGLSALGNVTLTNGTTTNIFSTTASSTNLFSALANIGGLNANLSTTTAATTTNLFATNANITNLNVTSCTGCGSGGTNPAGTGSELQFRDAGAFGAVTNSAYNSAIGTLGIGTTTPQYLLQLASSTAPQLALSDGTPTSNIWTFRNSGGVLTLATSSPGTYAISANPAFSIDNNGVVSVTNTISGSITGNAGTVTNGVYTTTFGDLFDTRLNATTTLPNLAVLNGLTDTITTRSTTTAATSTNLFATNAVITNLTATNPISASITGSAGSVAASALTGNTLAGGVTASSLTSLGTIASLLATNATTTNIFSTTASSTNLFSTNLITANATSTNLSVTNTINGSINGSAPAGSLTGTTLAGGVTSSSLTSLGTIVNLAATNATTTNIFSTTASSTNLFSTNANLSHLIVSISTTTAATSTNLAVTNTINGSISGSAPAGSLTGNTLAGGVTASSLTSVGTLSSLTLGGTLAMGTNNITSTGSLGTTGSRLTAGFFTDLTVTNAISGSVTGSAGSVAASALTGNTLASGVTASSLTSLGTIATLLATNATTTNIFSTTASSTNLFAAAATTSNLSVTNTINGSISGSAPAGSLTGTTLAGGVTASSLTSLGTLSSLTLGGTLAMGTNNITSSGSLGTTGTRLTAGFFTDLTVTNTISGSVTGSAGSVAASAITGTTLASNVVNSSLTSLGTIAALLATNATTTNIFSTTASSTNLFSSNGNIGGLIINTSTSTAATSTNLSVTNPISGSVTGSAGSATGNAGSATLTAVTDDTTTNATMFPTWVTTASGNQAQKVSSTKLTFNPSTGVLNPTNFLTTNGTTTNIFSTTASSTNLFAAAATTSNLFVTNTIGGSISGSAPAGSLTGTTLAGGVTASSLTSVGTLSSLTLGGTLAMGTNNITSTGSLGATGARLTAGFFTDLTVTNPISASITGSAGSVAASALTGNTLAGGVTASSLTSLGTIASLLATNATTTNIFSTTASSTNLFSSNGNIGGLIINTSTTTAATSTNLSVTNTISGAVSGNAGSATLTAVTDDTTTSSTMFPTWVTTASGNQAQKVSSTKLTFNPSTGVLNPTNFLTTNATTTNIFSTTASSTNLFSTNANISALAVANSTSTNTFATTASSTNLFASNANLSALTMSGTLAMGANNITSSGSLGTTGTRLTAGFFTDLTVTNAIAGAVTGNAGSATLTAVTDDTTTNATMFPTWVTTASGNQAQKVSSTKLTFNPSTGVLTSTNLSITNGTTTNIFSTTASSTNLFSTNGNIGAFIAQNATTTNTFSATASSTNLFSTNSNLSALTMSGTLAMGANNITSTGSLGATGARLTSGFFTDLTVTNAISGAVTGNAGSATLTAITDDTTTNSNMFLTWVTTASGNQAQKVSSTKLTFNPSTGVLDPTNLLTTNATTTNIFSTTASSTNLFAANANIANLTVASCAGCGGAGSSPAGVGTEIQYRNGTSFGAVASSAFDASLGAVGFGTTTPHYTLQLASSTAPQLALSDGTATSNHWTIRNGSGVLYIATSSPQTFATSSLSILTIDTSGTVSLGGQLALGVNSITSTGSLGATGARLTSGFFTDLTVTNAISGSITGSAPAGSLTGSTLAAGVTASSLTSLGTIANLLATNATTTNIFSTTASSTNLFSGLVTFGGNALTVDANASTTIKNLLLFDTGGNGLQWAIHENSNNDLEISYPSIKRGVLITSGTNGGMLGIGTSSILGYSTLIVASDTPSIDIMDNDAAAGSKHIVLTNSQGVFKIGSTTDTNSASSTFLTIANTNVGIGTTTPLVKLAVQGSVLFSDTSGSSNAFQVQNNAGVVVDNINTNTLANLISNAGFESNTNGWAPKGVTLVSYDATAGNAQFGNATLKATTTAATTDGVKYMVPLKPSQTYVFNVYAKVASGSVTAILGRQEINAVDTETSCAGFTITTTWTQFTCSFTTSATVSATTTNIYLRQTAAAANTIYMDGATLVTGTTGLAYDPGGNNFNIQSLNSILSLNSTNSGEVQPWQLSSSTLPGNREDAGTTNANGYVYVIGGFDGTNRDNTVYYSKMNADGSLAAWTTMATGLINNAAVAQNRQYPGVGSVNGYIYVVGGFDGTQANSSIFYAKLNGDGTVGTWYCQGANTAAGCGTTSSPANANGLPVAKVAPSVAIANGFIYVLGGCTDSAATCGTPSNVNYFAKLRADGSTGPFTATGSLSLSRGMGSAVFENGSVLFIGGRNTTGTTTVDRAIIASDGSLGAFSATGLISLPANRQEHTSAIIGGYVYVIGGSDGAASPLRESTVYYSRLNSDGTINQWQTSLNALPTGRSAQTTTNANGYIYVIGGCALQTAGACATNQSNSVLYTSGPRVLVGGSLDLVGLQGQSLADAGGAGALTAGVGRFIGDLRVDGYADFNNGLAVDSVLNINAVSADAGQPIFNINNSSSNSIFSIQHMNTTFGSVANAGAFIDSMSMFDEEFNVPKAVTAITADATSTVAASGVGLGDTGAFTYDTTGATATFSTPKSVVNGVARFNLSTTANGFVFAIGQAVAAYSGTYLKANLPVVQMKIKPSLVAATEDIRWGLMGVTDAASGTNEASSSDGIWFSNENGTSWVGVVQSGSATVGRVTCPGTVLTTQFATGRIVVESATSVRFLMDYDASNGINFIDCGTVTTTTNPSVALTLGIQYAHTSGTSVVLDVDYMKTWQDDNAPDSASLDALAPDAPSADIVVLTDATSTDEMTDASSTPALIFDAEESYLSLASTTERLDKRLASIEAMIATSTDATSTASTTISISGLNVSGHAVFNGGLIVGTLGETDINMDMIGDVTFFGRPYFTGDTAGSAIVKKGANIVTIKFDKDYIETPIVSANIALESASTSDALEESIFSSDIRYIVTRKDVHGFTILLNKPAPEDISFSWIALATKNQKLFTSRDEDILPAPVASSTPAVDTPVVDTPAVADTPIASPPATTTDASSTDDTATSTEPSLVPEAIPEDIVIPVLPADTATSTASTTP